MRITLFSLCFSLYILNAFSMRLSSKKVIRLPPVVIETVDASLPPLKGTVA
jgi:hypothetical protein